MGKFGTKVKEFSNSSLSGGLSLPLYPSQSVLLQVPQGYVEAADVAAAPHSLVLPVSAPRSLCGV